MWLGPAGLSPLWLLDNMSGGRRRNRRADKVIPSSRTVRKCAGMRSTGSGWPAPSLGARSLQKRGLKVWIVPGQKSGRNSSLA